MNNDIAKSIAKNTSIQFGQQLITWGSTFVLMLFLPRYLGPVKFGHLYLAEMVAGIFLVIVSYDGKFNIAKLVSRNREAAGDILVNALGFRAIFWLGSLAAMIVFSFVAGYPTAVRIMIVIFGVEMSWIAARGVYAGVFVGFENFKYQAISAIVERAFVSVVGVTALLLGGEEIVIALIMSVGTLLNFIICAKYIRKIIPPLPRFRWERAKELLKEGFPYLLWTIFGVVYYRIDTVMLSLMSPDAVVGWYGAAYKLYDVLAFLPSIFVISILPILSKLHGKEDMLLGRTTQKGLNFIFLCGIPMSILCFWFSREIIGLLFGMENYRPAVVNLQIFSAGLLLLYVDMVLGTALIACDKQKQVAWVAFIAVIVNISLNYVMIPYAQLRSGNGGIGAAVATVITEFFVLVCNLMLLPKSIFQDSENRVFLKSLAGGAVTVGALALLRSQFPLFPWMVGAAIGGGLYLAVLLAMKTFTRTEIEFIRQFLSVQNIRKYVSSSRQGDV